VSSREIAEHYHIPPDLLGKVLQALTRGGLIQSTHGARGGYKLDRPLAAISIGDVVAAVEGPVQLTACSHGDETCPQASTCTIREPVEQVQEMLVRFISGISLSAFKSHGTIPSLIESNHCICGVCTCSSQNQKTPAATSVPSAR
jgi:Rrf2 family protein